MDDRISSSKRKMEEDFLDESLSTSNNSLSDRDTDYNPPGKKAKKKVENGRNTKKLTPEQRIARLNKKINSIQLGNAQKDTRIQTNPMANESVSNSTGKQSPAETASSIESLDIFFVDDDGQLILSETNGTADLRKSCNTSNIMDDKDKINDKPRKNTETSTLMMQPPESTDILSMLISLSEKINEMNGEMFSLRRQVARIEAKSTVYHKPNETHPASEMDNVFLDFEGSLAAEGLPIKSIDGVNALENRLADTAYSASSYRQKLVCIFLDIHKFYSNMYELI